jgi:transcriptional regulator with XRE-family HTH domain
MSSSSTLVAMPYSDTPPPAERRELKNIMALESFGLMLKRLRRRRGLTLAHVADAIGVSKPSVWAWENGKCRPHPARIARIAAVLGALPEDLADVPLASIDPYDVIEDCRRRIAMAYGTESGAVRIMVEL